MSRFPPHLPSKWAVLGVTMTATELLALIKAVPGRYVSHDAGDCRLRDPDGGEVLGPIPVELLDTLQDHGYIVYADHRYSLPPDLGPIEVEV